MTEADLLDNVMDTKDALAFNIYPIYSRTLKRCVSFQPEKLLGLHFLHRMYPYRQRDGRDNYLVNRHISQVRLADLQ